MIRTVNSADALIKALKASAAGDTILLSAGNYSALDLNGVKFTGGVVTIQSADPNNMAVLNGLQVQNSSGLVFKQLDLSSANGWGAYLSRVNNVSFIGSTFHGTAVGDHDALMIRDSKAVTVTSSTFFNLGTGINELDSSNVTISSNKFYKIAGDEVRGTNVTNSTITNNTFVDADPKNATHSDAIHLWQDNTANKVTISGNTFGSGTTTTTPPATTPPPTTTTTPPATTTPPSTTNNPPTTNPPSTTTPVTPTSPTTSSPSTSAPVADATEHVFTVSTTDQLLATLKKAVAGDVIQLVSGSYSAIELTGFNFTGAVTIQSADPSNMAQLHGLAVNNSSGLVFKQLDLATGGGWGAYVSGANNVTFVGDTFHGAAVGDGGAMMIRDSKNITVTASDFHNLGTGINELDSSGITISSNRFDDIQDEAIRGTNVTNEQIVNNTFVDASPTNATHSDVIHLWQDNTANNVTISGNVYGTGATTPPPATTTPPVTTAPADTTTTTPPTTSSIISAPTAPVDGGHVYTVTNASELFDASRKAVDGDTIKLAPGTYDYVVLYGVNTHGNVTITSATSTQAVIKGIDLNGVSGLTFSNLEVLPADYNGKPLYLQASENVTFDNLTIHGAPTGYEGLGIQIRSSTGITVQNSDLHHLGAGVSVLQSEDVVVSGNRFHEIGVDGVLGAGVGHMVVENNTFTNFHSPDWAHPDAIQFFNSNGVGNHDLTITGNVITRGDGNAIQGIFFEDSRDVLVSGNAMSGVMTNGISVARGANYMISNNFLQGFSDSGTRIIVREASSDVTVVHNTTEWITNYVDYGLPNPNFVDSGNTLIAGAAIGDLTALNSWLAQHKGVTAALTGGQGDDYLTGTAGADTMAGGFGDDVYEVGTNDVVSEATLEGVDTVRTGLSSYTLGANVENLVLTGSTAQTAVGNGLNNVLISNAAGSRLDGGAGNDDLVSVGGADTLTGGAGVDTFRFLEATGKVAQITDFVSGMDKLDLHNVLAKYEGTDPVADQWLKVQSDGTGSTLYVDVDGPTGSAGMVAVTKLLGVSTISSGDWLLH